MDKAIDKLLYIFYGIVIFVVLGLGLYFYNKQYSFSIIEKDITMLVGDKYSIQLYTSNGYFDTNNYSVTLSNDNLSNESLTFTALKEGITEVKIKSKKGFNSKKIRVTTINSKVESLVTEDKVTSSINDTKKVDVVINDDEKIKTNLKYESLNPEVASVDDNGNITGINAGTTTIKITYSDDVYTYTDVEIVAEKIELKDIEVPSVISLKPGDEQKISVIYYPTDATDKEVKYKSNNEKIAKVVSGKVIGIGDGKTSIIVTSGKIKKEIKVVVSSPVVPTSTPKVTATPTPTGTPLSTETPEPTTSTKPTSVPTSTPIVTPTPSTKPTSTPVSTPTVKPTLTPTSTPVQKRTVSLIRGTIYNNGFLHYDDIVEYNSSVRNNCNNADSVNNQLFTLFPANNKPNFQECHYEGNTKVYSATINGSNDKLVKVTPNDEVQLDVNTYNKSYSPTGNSWPHLLISGRTGLNGLGVMSHFNDRLRDHITGLTEADRPYFYFNNDKQIDLSLDVRINSFKKGNPINGVQAFQYLIYLEIYCDSACGGTQKMYWFGFNLFDDRGILLHPEQGEAHLDEKTNSLTVTLPSDTIYTNGTLYNNGNFVYGEWKHVQINLSQRVNELLTQIHLSGYPNVKASDLRYAGFNIGFEVHGEYWTSMSFKNLSLTSKDK